MNINERGPIQTTQSYHDMNCFQVILQNELLPVGQMHMFSKGIYTSPSFEIWFHVAVTRITANMGRFKEI